jgi:hypothetical protein
MAHDMDAFTLLWRAPDNGGFVIWNITLSRTGMIVGRWHKIDGKPICKPIRSSPDILEV